MITSTSNQRVKELSQIQKKSKIRSREGIFIAEGIRMVRETPHERLVGLYFSESFEKKYGKEVLDVISGGDLKVREQIRKKTEILSDAVFSYVSDTKTPQGVLAVVHQMEWISLRRFSFIHCTADQHSGHHCSCCVRNLDLHRYRKNFHTASCRCFC